MQVPACMWLTNVQLGMACVAWAVQHRVAKMAYLLIVSCLFSSNLPPFPHDYSSASFSLISRP